MTIYKSDKNLFSNETSSNSSSYSYGSYASSESYGSQRLGEVLDGIEEVKLEIEKQGLNHLFPRIGTSTILAKKERSELKRTYNHANQLTTLAGRIHEEVLQNIDGKITQAMNDAVKALDMVNEGDNVYKTKSLTYQEVRHTGGYGATGPTSYSVNKSYTLDQILNSEDTPIHAAKDLYEQRLALINQLIADGEIKDKDTINELKEMNDEELINAFFPTQMGEFEELTSTWHEENEGWLNKVDIALAVVTTIALAASAVVTGGASLVLAGSAITYLGAKAAHGVVTGTDMITGEVLDTSDKVWQTVDFASSALSFGASSLITKLGSSLAEGTTLRTALKLTSKADDLAGKVDSLYTAFKNPVLGTVLYGAEKGASSVATKVIGKINFRKIQAAIDESSLGQGWKDYYDAGDYNALYNKQKNRLDKLNREFREIDSSFSKEDLAIINKYYDFQLPHGVGDDAFTGIAIKKWDENLRVSADSKQLIKKFEKAVRLYNDEHSTVKVILSDKDVEEIADAAGEVTATFIEEGIPERTMNRLIGMEVMDPKIWKEITDEIKYPLEYPSIS